MIESIIQNKINLFVENYNETQESKLSWKMGMMQYSCILSTTINEKKIDKSKLEDGIDVIKKNTGIFSNFRGHSSFYLSTILANKVDKDREVKSILDIYEKLKDSKFSNDTYLPFTAIILHENQHKLSADTAIERTKYVYDFMKKHHPWLTSSDDYCRAAIIALNSNDLDNDLEYMEDSYTKLNQSGFYKSNDLQSLSHIMALSKNRENKVEKIVAIKKLLEDSKMRIDSNGYPLLGVLALIETNEKILIEQISQVSDELSKVKGLGNWSLGKSNRNMISMALVCSAYAKYFNEESEIDSISNNVILDIIIAIEIAIMVSTIAAISASSSN